MKLRLLSAAIISIFIFTLLSGCSTKSIDKQFIDALKKSSSIQRASDSININISLDLDNSNLSPEEKSLLAPYKSIKVALETKKDTEKKRLYLEGNATINGMSINFKLYQKDNKTLLEIPLLGKYIVLDDKSQAVPKLDEATQIGIMNIINETVTKDNIKKAGTEKLAIGDETSDVTRFEISLGDSEIKNVFTKAIDLFSSDKQLKSQIIGLIKTNTQEAKTDKEIEDIFTSLLSEAKKEINNTRIESFQYKGAINKDLIIIQEDFSSNITLKLSESKSLKLNMKIDSKTYDIDKYLDFEMPVADEFNSITIEDLYNMTNTIN